MNMKAFIIKINKKTYLLIFSLILIVTGNILMAATSQSTPTYFDESIYNFRVIILAPIVILSGFITLIYSIMIKK